MKWMYLYLPDFYLQRSTTEDHRAQGLLAPGGQHLLSCNASARQHGLSAKMLLGTAFCLCPELEVLSHDRTHHQRLLNSTAEGLSCFSAWVAVDGEDGFWLEVGSMRRHFGSYRRLREQLCAHLQAQNLSGFLAVAPNASAARLFARSHEQRWLTPARLRKQLETLPVEALPLSEKGCFRLYKLGIRHLHALCKLPRRDLDYRIERGLSLELARITGEVNWQPQAVAQNQFFQQSVDLEQAVEDLSALLPLLESTLKRFCRYLHRHDLHCSRAHLFFIYGKYRPDSQHALSLSCATRQETIWIHRLQTLLEHIRLQAPVLGFRLEADEFSQQAAPANDLFDHKTTQANAREELINRLSSRLGHSRVYFLAIDADPRPEQQTCFTAAADFSSNSEPVCWQPEGTLPLWLLPRAYTVNHQAYTLQHAPLRLASGWWNPRSIHRDYYLARHCEGSLHWLFKLPGGQHWYWHGLFA